MHFYVLTDDMVNVFTSDSNYRKMHLSTMNRDNLVFEVMATADASIALSYLPSNFDVQTAEIVIGAHGNTRTVIRKEVNGEEMATVDSADVLSGSERRWFWVKWSGSVISVGKGQTLDQDTLLSHTVSDTLVISSLAVTTSGSTKGEWYIPYSGK